MVTGTVVVVEPAGMVAVPVADTKSVPAVAVPALVAYDTVTGELLAALRVMT